MIEWVKRNKLASLVILVLLFLVVKNSFSFPLRNSVSTLSIGSGGGYGVNSAMPSVGVSKMVDSSLPMPIVQEAAPTTSQNRMVVQESSMSMVVSDVRGTSDKIVSEAKSLGGYMVNTSLSSPEEAPFAQVVIRVPADKLKSALDTFRGLAMRVTDENLMGTDVTDQYTDIQARLDTLNKTKVKFEEIMTKATAVGDILSVQQQLTYIQDQIDSLKGQQLYLEQTAKLAKMTVYLSTDEFSLPYAPANRFRPDVIFKEAIRSLVSNARDFAGLLIWVVVYSVIWVPLGLIAFVIWKKKFRKTI